MFAVVLSNLFLFLTPDSFFLNLNPNPEEYYQRKVVSLLTSLRTSSVSLISPYTALPIVILAAAPFVLGRRYGKQVLLAATTCELVLIASTANPSLSWHDILTPPASVAQLPDTIPQKQARLHGLRTAENTGKYLTNPESLENTTTRKQLRELLVPLIHAQFNLPGVAWPASLDLTNQAQVLHDLNESLKNDKTDFAEEVNISAVLKDSGLEITNPRPRAEFLDGTPVEYQEITPSHIRLIANSSEGGTLLIRDTFYPGWHATLDSTRRVEIGPAGPNNIFRAIEIPAGVGGGR